MENETLDTFEKALTVIIFALAFLMEFLFVCRYGLRADKAALAIMAAYLVMMLARIFSKPNDLGVLGALIPIGNCIIYGVLIYFIFEMSYIKAKLESNNTKEYLEREAYLDKRRIIIGVIFFIVFEPL